MNDVLLLSDDNYLKRILLSELKPYQISLQVVDHITKGLESIQKHFFKSVVIQWPIISESCPKKVISQIKSIQPYIPIYFLMDQINHHEIISLVKHGAENIFMYPYNFTHLCQEIHETVKKISTLNEVPQWHPNKAGLKKATETFRYLKANSKAAKTLSQQIDKVADTNFTVIIYGETGTGKESVARRLCEGRFKNQPFVAVDCGCLSKDLAASELFGHKKGSFTSAISDKVGAFEEANHGTLFLDEIGNLDYNVQIQLLRAIEEKKIKKIGSLEEKEVDVRIIVASNEKLLQAVKEGRFREDLYYRLNEFEINIPPLRKRKDDIVPFIEYFIEEANKDLNKHVQGVEESLLQLLLEYHWPGNIRELKNIIRRGCLMADRWIDQDCMTQEFLSQLKLQNAGVEAYAKDSSNLMKQKVVKMEYEQIMSVLVEENFNKTTTAHRLQMNRKTLYNKLKNYEQMMKSQSLSI